jgi:hypothetical protein
MAFFLLKTVLPEVLKGGAYFEFGLYNGRSMAHALDIGDLFADSKFRYLAFDPSFYYKFSGFSAEDPGQLVSIIYPISTEQIKYNLFMNRCDVEKIEFFKGNFSFDTFSAYDERFKFPQPSIISFVIPFYNPTKSALDHFLPHCMLGTILIFDSFSIQPDPRTGASSQSRAFSDWRTLHPSEKFLPIFPIGNHGRAFMKIESHQTGLDPTTLERVKKLVAED